MNLTIQVLLYLDYVCHMKNFQIDSVTQVRDSQRFSQNSPNSFFRVSYSKLFLYDIRHSK